MTYLTETRALSELGFNPNEVVTSEFDFQKQLESYALHVIEDLPVSNRYSYIYDQERQKIFTESEAEVFIDPEERGGLPVSGTIRAIEMSLENPDKLVFLYSPPGPVAFRSGTKYDQVKPYPSGQLYILKAREDSLNIVDCIALSVGKDYESEVLDIFFGRKRPGFDDEIQKIIYYLTNPITTDLSYKNLIGLLKEKGDEIFYENARGEIFTFKQVADLLSQGLEGLIRPKLSFDYRNLYEQALIDPRLAYLQQLYHYTNIFGNIPLGGSCGGSKARQSEIESILNFNPLSTIWRTIDIFNFNNEKSDEYGSLTFICPHCGNEVQRPPHTLIDVCPYCGDDVKCK